jgi:hypothetical protein
MGIFIFVSVFDDGVGEGVAMSITGIGLGEGAGEGLTVDGAESCFAGA